MCDLAKGAVTGAWHIGQDAIVGDTSAARERVIVAEAQIGQRARVLIDDHEVGRLEALELMHEHVTALVLQIVGDHEARRYRQALVLVERLDELRCLAARRRTHVLSKHRQQHLKSINIYQI